VHRIVAAVAALAAAASTLSAQDTVLAAVSQRLAAMQPELVTFRRDLHRHPEVSGAEVRTAARIAEQLRQRGLEVRTGVGGHGVVAVVRGAKPGPVVAYRADMDAVPSSDRDPVDFRSLNPGVRHICGHDIHTTIGLALAAALQAARAELPGTVLFLFQPAEERATGAHAMLADGVFGTLHPVAIYGLHTAPYNVGELATIDGDMMSGRDGYLITLRGTGNVDAAARTVRQQLEALSTVTPAQMLVPGPRDLILVATERDAESASTRTMRGTIMATSLSRPRIEAAMAAIRAQTVPNVAVTVDYRPKAVAGVTNDAALTRHAMGAAASVVGPAAMLTVDQIIPAFSEDFGAFQDRVPGVFFFLGVSSPTKGTVGMPHTPDYVADEGAIQVGAKAMAAVLLDRLRR
jgi:metal-dependent amidase/aminoacylase/carboxypeptidase family protein